MPRLDPRTRFPRVAHPRRLAALPIAAATLLATPVLVGTTAATATTTTFTAAGPSTPGGSGSRTGVLADHPKWAVQSADRGALDDTTTLTARVGLTGRDPDGLIAFATAVSTPDSPLYRHFLSPAQVRARYGPAKQQVAKVRHWLTEAGLTIADQNTHWIDVTGPASAMRRAFGARIDAYEVEGGVTRHAPATDLSVPADVSSAVSSVAGLSTAAHGDREGATGAAKAAERVRSGVPEQQVRMRRTPDPQAGSDLVTPQGSVQTPMPQMPAETPASTTLAPQTATPASQTATTDPNPIHPPAVARLPIAAKTLASPTPRDRDAASSTPPCSPTWGAITATGFPPGYTATTPYDICGYVPGQLRRAYGVSTSGRTGAGFTIAIVDAYGSSTMLADANRFAVAHGDRPFAAGQYVEDVNRRAWTHLTDGMCQTPADWAGEEALDVEMVHGLAPDAAVRYIGANSCTDQDLTTALAKVVDQRSADVVSASFGETMHQTGGDIDPAVVAQENAVFVAGAAEGIGFDVASGDCGNDAPGLKGPNCDPHSARAQTEWPASSLWVTAVGGTALATTADGRYRWETTMGDKRSVLSPDGRSWDPFPGFFYFGGGGGTSEDFAQPAYQRAVVPDALSHTLATGAHSAKPMRTVPDVAMNGDLLTAVFVGQTDPATGAYTEAQIGGTSAAAPMFAAMQAVTMQAAQARFGFANPVLYSRAGTVVYRDVVEHPAGAPRVVSTILDLGRNTDGTRKVRLYELGKDNGLSAGLGYDLATGLGSPGPFFVNGFR